MNWKQKTAIRILLTVAKLISDEAWSKEIDGLITEVRFYSPKVEAA